MQLSGMAETCEDLSLRLGILLLEQNDHSVDVKGVGEAFQWASSNDGYSHSGCYLESTIGGE